MTLLGHAPCENPRCGLCFVQPFLTKAIDIATVPMVDGPPADVPRNGRRARLTQKGLEAIGRGVRVRVVEAEFENRDGRFLFQSIEAEYETE